MRNFSMWLVKGLGVWVLICVAAIVNGAFREIILKRKLKEDFAHVVSTLILCSIVFACGFGFRKWIGVDSLGLAWLLGSIWLTSTLAFEFLAGHYAFGNPWSKILADYRVDKARIWILVPIVTLFALPIAAQGFERSFVVPFLMCQLIAITSLFLSVASSFAGRWFHTVLFVCAGLFNIYLATTTPEAYVTFADRAILPVMASFIKGWFSLNVALVVISIAVGQIICAILLQTKSRRWGLLGICSFLFGISWLGIGSAFPVPMVLALAAIIATERSTTN